MQVALIDVVEWQTLVESRTGQPVEIQHPRLDIAAQVCATHPYPGDLTMEGAKWVTDTALDLYARYAPDFFFLDYASLYLQSLFRPEQEKEQGSRVPLLFAEIQRFLDATGFEPVIVGLGDLMPLRGYIETTDLDGLASAAGMNTRSAGLFAPSERDLNRMSQREGVERLVSREDFRAEFGGSEGFYATCPDYLIFARPGYVFRGVNISCRTLYRLPIPEEYIPIHTMSGSGQALTDIPEMVLQGLAHHKVALILVEAVGCDSFPLTHRPLSNSLHWYRYTMGPGQYLALTSGKHFVEYPYPPGYRLELYDDENAPYPFSGVFREMPDHTTGRRFQGRSAAVGNRSILTHLAAGTDICIECFARGLYSHGVLAMVEV
jgi:hypothetical protein